jgi:hypothetical protein
MAGGAVHCQSWEQKREQNNKEKKGKGKIKPE